MRARPVILAVVLAVIGGACSAGAAATPGPTAEPATTAATSAGAAATGGGPLAGPITTSGPVGWNRGPYELAGGSYELSWESDGSCSVLYFGIVGVSNGFKEQPPTAGDVPTAQITGGSRTIENVPPGAYFFNVSGMACKSYRGTLTPKS